MEEKKEAPVVPDVPVKGQSEQSPEESPYDYKDMHGVCVR
jgi:hypothetical protein